MPEPRPATILHISDCHLDDQEDSLCRLAFASAIDLSRALDVDLLLITGDLFDHSRVRDPLLEWTADNLDRADRPVVLIVGNHDSLNETSVHHRFAAEARCKQVTFLDDPAGTSVEVPGTDILVWGKAMVEHDPGYRPLAGAPGRVEGRWNVIAAHGLVMDGRVDPGRSSPILTEELDNIDADYVALGHIHTFQLVRQQPLTAYAGATASPAAGGQPGAVVVELKAGCAPTLSRWNGEDTSFPAEPEAGVVGG
jgi:DNA repair exonuclease SbcCD nuclease subunit